MVSTYDECGALITTPRYSTRLLFLSILTNQADISLDPGVIRGALPNLNYILTEIKTSGAGVDARFFETDVFNFESKSLILPYVILLYFIVISLQRHVEFGPIRQFSLNKIYMESRVRDKLAVWVGGFPPNAQGYALNFLDYLISLEHETA